MIPQFHIQYQCRNELLTKRFYQTIWIYKLWITTLQKQHSAPSLNSIWFMIPSFPAPRSRAPNTELCWKHCECEELFKNICQLYEYSICMRVQCIYFSQRRHYIRQGTRIKWIVRRALRIVCQKLCCMHIWDKWCAVWCLYLRICCAGPKSLAFLQA